MFHFSFVILKVLWRVWAIWGELQNPFKDKKIASVFWEDSYWILEMQDCTREVGMGKWILKWWITGDDLKIFISYYFLIVLCLYIIYKSWYLYFNIYQTIIYQ